MLSEMSNRTRSADPVIQVIERSNQRGGRMLSVIDLLQRGTLSKRQLAWLMVRIEQGASWLVGAVPGGAGKTTVMSALLGVLPAQTLIRVVQPSMRLESLDRGTCLVIYEIGKGRYDGYVWGQELRRVMGLVDRGYRVVANLHADTLAQARELIVTQNGVPAQAFDALGLFLPITLEGAHSHLKRRIRQIDRVGISGWQPLNLEAERPTQREQDIGHFCAKCLAEGVVEIQDVRRAWLAWKSDHPMPSNDGDSSGG